MPTPFLSRFAPLLLVSSLAWSQIPVPAGSGSYASFPPPQAGAGVDSFERLSRLDVRPGERRAIPTNDWWTDVLVSAFAGDLWAHPLVADPDERGVRVWFPTEPADDGNGMKRGDPIRIAGAGFAPTRDLAWDWGDWHVVVRLEDGDKHLDMTLLRGSPVVWFEVSGFSPRLELPAGMVPRSSTGTVLGGEKVATDRLVLVKESKAIGVQLPEGATVSFSAGILSLDLPPEGGWLSLASLPAATDLDAWREWAVVVPRSSVVSWRRKAPATMRVEYAISGQDLSGKGGTNLLQAFPPHAWRDASSAPAWRKEAWRSPRGLLKAALGRSFVFEYASAGILPDYGNAEPDPEGEANPWNREVQDAMVSNYLGKATYGADTYWGGKDLVLLAKHALFASRTRHPDAQALLRKAEEALADWLTWTPGEKAHYFAWYPRWKGLVGFEESYGSSQFTDNHFHYGYLVHAAALVGMLDPRFVQSYGPMLRKVAAQYANWDRQDSSLPFLRTFEPWTGHSYAGGTSSPGGNNQESTSEAMQSWIGLHLLGSVLGDTAMRDAGQFGYMMESRATMEYWFDWKGGNFAPGWAHSNVGIVFDGGLVYGTWFSGNPLHIHAIQYLPMCPGFQYLARDTAWARREYGDMQREASAAEGYTDETDYGDDWANVAFSFRQLFEPAQVCRRFDQDRKAGAGWTREANATATYAYAHANRQLGPVAWEYTYSLPSAMGFRKDGRVTHVVWNPSSQEAVCEVLREGVPVGTIRIPARTVVRHRMDAKLAALRIEAPGKTLSDKVPTRLGVVGVDQYGATIDVPVATWSSSTGSIDATGLFTPSGATDSVVIRVRSGEMETSLRIRTGELPTLAKLRIHPAYVQMLKGAERPLSIRGMDQYGDPVSAGEVTWTVRGPVVLSGNKVAGTGTGTGWVVASAGAVTDSIPVDVYDHLLDLSAGAKITASSTLGTNVPAMAMDGDARTRWESVHGIDSSWIRFELDTVVQLTDFVVSWENAAAARYQVQVSDDGSTWRTWAEVTGGDGGLDSLSGTGHGRFVRLSASARTTAYGYSIWETRLWGFPRTVHSARLDSDTLWGTDPLSGAESRARHAQRRAVHVGGRVFQVEMAPEESVQEAWLVDLRGRTLSPASSGRGMALLRIRTERSVKSIPVLLSR